ncbi:MAG TPA: LPS assembly lipoprotein LptE [Myxococcota bacterium]|nr:LPS assembly lipoprotein LptE [Myxococcota bacterium]
MIYLPGVKGRALALSTALAVVLTQGSGCGYQFVDYKAPLGDVRRVAFQTLRNDSYDPGYEAVMTDSLVREFRRRGAFMVVDDPKLADLVITGRVRPIFTVARSFSSVLLALEWSVTVTLDLKALRRDGRAVAIDGSALSQSEIYLASADIEAVRKNRQEALHHVSQVLAERVHDALYERLLP